MSTAVVFDCESDGKPVRSGTPSEQDFRHVQCTVACGIVLNVDNIFSKSADVVLNKAKQITCWRDVAPTKGANPFEELFQAFDDADVIVGFNSLDFDMPLLRKHYGCKGARRYMEHRLKSLDMFSRLRSVTNSWPKLDDLLSQNNLVTKSGDGAKAIVLWEKQKRVELQKYCMDDVKRTAELSLLSKLRMGDNCIPEHVFGLRPMLRGMRLSSRDSPSHPQSPTLESNSDNVLVDGGFVLV
tara:strand:- start:3005 stop:3727 length:723 start_codon:yes stop_codon:yes gene_type:complete